MSLFVGNFTPLSREYQWFQRATGRKSMLWDRAREGFPIIDFSMGYIEDLSNPKIVYVAFLAIVRGSDGKNFCRWPNSRSVADNIMDLCDFLAFYDLSGVDEAIVALDFGSMKLMKNQQL